MGTVVQFNDPSNVEVLLRKIVAAYDDITSRNELPDAIAAARRYLDKQKTIQVAMPVKIGDPIGVGHIHPSPNDPVWLRG
jgi:hypothetical protein